MRDIELLLDDIINNKVQVSELNEQELDAVMEELTEIGESLLHTDNHDAGVAILKALDIAIDIRVMSDKFEQAIIDAQARGSVYFELNERIIH